MQPAWQTVVEIGVGLTAYLMAFVVEMWLDTTRTRRWILTKLLAWLSFAFIGTLPFAIIDQNAGWTMAGLVLATVCWGLMEMRRRWYAWRIDVIKQQQRTVAFRKFTAKSFDD